MSRISRYRLIGQVYRDKGLFWFHTRTGRGFQYKNEHLYPTPVRWPQDRVIRIGRHSFWYLPRKLRHSKDLFHASRP